MSPDYQHAIAWVVYNRGGGGGHRRELRIPIVSGWIVTRMIADLFGRDVRRVAADIIAMEDGNELSRPTRAAREAAP